MEVITATSAKKAYNATRLVRVMFKAWYAKNECHDPKCMDVQLHDVRLINHGTALDVVIRVFNRGFSPLLINGGKIQLLVAGHLFEFPYLVQNQHLEPECFDGRLCHFIVQAPFLTQSRFLSDLKDTDINNIDIGLQELHICFSRRNVAATREFDVSGRTDWQREIKGIPHYCMSA